MSKKIFFIVLTCCLLVATFCVSFAGAPQVQSAPADIRAVLDRPDCASAPLIVPPVVEPPMMDFVIPTDDLVYSNENFYRWDSLDANWIDAPTFSSGIYFLSFVVSGPVTGDVAFYEGGSLTLLGFAFDSAGSSVDVTSSVSSFSLLYSNYSGFSFEYSPSVSSLDSFVFYMSGMEYTVEGSIAGVYFSTDSDFYVYTEDESLSLSYRAYYPEYFVSPIISTFVSGLRALGTNVGRAFSTIANAIFINADGTGLSTFGILVVVFAAISLGLSLTRWVLNFCSSCGKRNR